MILVIIVAAYYILDNFREKGEIEKLAEIIHIEDTREITEELKLYLNDQDSKLRSRAALAIGRIGTPEAAPLLLEVAKADISDVAAVASFALGLTGDKDYADEMIDLAFDAPSRVSAAMVDAAGRLSDSSMTDIIKSITSLLDHPAPEVRTAACYALFRANAKKEASALKDFIKEEKDEEVQIAALFALARLRIEDAFDIYTTYLADADPYVRSLALRGVALSDSKEAIQYLSIALNDSDPNVIATAITGLSGKENKTAKRNLSRKLTNVKDEKLTVAIIDALRRMKSDEPLADIEAILNDSTKANIVAAAIKYIAEIKKDRSVVLIDSLMNHPNPIIKRACVDAFGLLNDSKNISRLAMLFSDKDELTRASAFGYLMELDTTVNNKFYLDQALADSGSILPSLAIDHIKSNKLTEYLPKLRTMMLDNTTGTDIKRSLIDCASAFIEKDNSDSSAMRILVTSILDDEYIIRREAATIYKDKLGEDRYNMVVPAKTRITESEIEDLLKDYKKNPTAKILTAYGEIEIDLLIEYAPLTVINFMNLAKANYYDGIIFHRVIPNFVAQAGDPTGTGWGGPGYMIRCEYSTAPYKTGTVGMATSGKDTGGSQFFITHSPQPHLDGRYTVFGQVVSGMDVVDKLVVGDTILSVSIR